MIVYGNLCRFHVHWIIVCGNSQCIVILVRSGLIRMHCGPAWGALHSVQEHSDEQFDPHKKYSMEVLRAVCKAMKLFYLLYLLASSKCTRNFRKIYKIGFCCKWYHYYFWYSSTYRSTLFELNRWLSLKRLQSPILIHGGGLRHMGTI